MLAPADLPRPATSLGWPGADRFRNQRPARAAARGALKAVSVAARFAVMFAVQFTAIGVMQPFLPVLFATQGASAEAVGILLAAGSLTRLVAGPMGGRIADALGDPRFVMAGGTAVAAIASLGFLWAEGFWPLLGVSLAMAIAMAPNLPLGDSMAAQRARREDGFDYGRVRSAGSLSFIAAAAFAGWVTGLAGPASVAVLLAGCFAAAAATVLLLPKPASHAARPGAWGGFAAVFRLPAFRRLLPVSALVQGSHALYYGFGALHWQAAGMSPTMIGLLWGGAVLAEFFFFLWGRGLVERLGPFGLVLLAAGAGVLRWSLFALDPPLPVIFAANLLHAATFGAMHLAAIRVLGHAIPPALAATAQTLHASLGVGLTMATLTLACGPLYAWAGGHGYWAMAGLSALSLLAALRLRGALRMG